MNKIKKNLVTYMLKFANIINKKNKPKTDHIIISLDDIQKWADDQNMSLDEALEILKQNAKPE